jgi:hypothetical protein
MRFQFSIDGRVVDYDVEGDLHDGADHVLLDHDDDLIAGTPWRGDGYTVAPFLAADVHAELVDGIAALVQSTTAEVLGRPRHDFRLETYHHHVTDDSVHNEVVRRTFHGRNTMADFPIQPRHVVRRISEICGVELTLENPERPACFNVRICRPNMNDHNPPHRDVWLDRLRHAVNIYVPIAGSTSASALALVPGSHRWKESTFRRTAQGARVNGRTYSVPTVVSTASELNLIRPNPGENEVLVFSPYLLHGGSVNLNPDATRVSLEMRFRRA